MPFRTSIAANAFLLLLLAVLCIGCEKSKTPVSKKTADTPNTQAAPSQEPSTPQHVASTPAHATISREPPLDISAWLRPTDVEKIIGHKSLSVEPLAGQPAAPDYNALRIFATDASDDSYGVSLQVWQHADLEAAKNRLSTLKQQYLGVQNPPTTQQLTEDGFISERAGIRSYLFVAPPTNVIGLSCATDQCSDWATLIELGATVQSRI